MAVLSAFFAALVLCVYGWGQGNVYAMLAMPFPAWLFFVNSGHDASHQAFSHKPWVNNIMAWSAAPLFYLPVTWYAARWQPHHTINNQSSPNSARRLILCLFGFVFVRVLSPGPPSPPFLTQVRTACCVAPHAHQRGRSRSRPAPFPRH